MSKPKILIVILVAFLLCDTAYSFLQYYYTPIDGDLTAGVVPSDVVQQVLDDPFGFHILSSGQKHVNPNRFFGHFFIKEYMQKVPLWLQNLTAPITSVYLSFALIKLFIHLMILFILAALSSGTKNVLDKKFLICAALIVPLIQANGYWGHMGINDKATTYTFFYALPIVLLMLYLMPLHSILYENKNVKLNVVKYILIFSMAVILPLSGPLDPAIILIVSALIGVYYLKKISPPITTKGLPLLLKQIPGTVIALLVPACLVSLYSLFLGQFDSNYDFDTLPVANRYMRLPLGIYYQVSQSLGVPLILIIISANVYLIKKKYASPEGQKIVDSLKWIGIFAAFYLLLLPLGGYRPYRPNILRYDTFLPITLALIYFYAHSSFFIFKQSDWQNNRVYLVILFSFLAIYMFADKPNTQEYYCERKALEYLANSKEEITGIPTPCLVMSWDAYTDPKRSEYNAIMLKHWNITKQKRLYYHENISVNP